jgi:hypothetical protein
MFGLHIVILLFFYFFIFYKFMHNFGTSNIEYLTENIYFRVNKNVLRKTNINNK